MGRKHLIGRHIAESSTQVGEVPLARPKLVSGALVRSRFFRIAWVCPPTSLYRDIREEISEHVSQFSRWVAKKGILRDRFSVVRSPNSLVR